MRKQNSYLKLYANFSRKIAVLMVCATVLFSVGCEEDAPTKPNIKRYTINVSETIGGTVSTKPSNLTHIYAGTNVTLTAEADSISGYRFKNWTRKGTDEFLSRNNPYSFTINRHDSIVANFEIATYRIVLYTTSIGVCGEDNCVAGTIYADMDFNNIPGGSYVTVLAIADSSFMFDQWTLSSKSSTTISDNPYTFKVISDDTLTAIFR